MPSLPLRSRKHFAFAAVLPLLAATFLVGIRQLPATAQTADAPQLEVSKTTGLDPDGETITISGTGFDPDANMGNRPPLLNQRSGFYVVFGDFATDWKPSDGAGSGARPSIEQRWVLPQPSFDIIEGMQPGQAALLEDDGTFSFELEVFDDGEAEGNLGIYLYPGSGAENPAYELSELLTFAGGDDPVFDPELEVSKTTDLDPDGETITISGTGFDPDATVGTRPPLLNQRSGFYVAFGDFDTDWRPSDGAGSGARTIIEQRWVLPQPSFDIIEGMQPGQAVLLEDDGSFSLELEVADEPDATGNLGIYLYPGSGAENADYELSELLSFASDDDTPTTSTTEPTTTTTEPTTTTTEPVTSGEAIVLGGEMEWGLYQGLVKYITGPIADGYFKTAGGASGAPKGPFLFPAVTGDEIDVTASDLTIPFSGSVKFAGHDYGEGPFLESTFSNFVVRKTGNTGQLRSDVVARPFEAADPNLPIADLVTHDDAHVADLDFSQSKVGRIGEDGVGWLSVPATLTKKGVEILGPQYSVGDKLDPVSIRLELSEVPDGLGEATQPPGPAGPTVNIDVTSVAPGGVIQVTATGFLPNEQIEVWMHSTPEFLETVRADDSGAVNASITIPLTATPGTHRLELRGISSELSAFSPEFQVVGSAAGGLPRTGSDTGLLVPMAMSLLTAGGVIVFATRRRRLATVHAD